MKTLIVILSFTLCISNAFGQQVEISGTVTDENNLPFPNAKVMVKDTDNETQTDEDGTYTISAEIGQYLVFSHVGYYNLTVMVEDDSPIDMVMERDDATVIAIIAGGFKSKRKQGYAVSTICGTDIENSPIKDVSIALNGRASGVRSSSHLGFVGSPNSVIVRGLNSFNGSNHPLYVIDGVPYGTNAYASGIGFFCDDGRGWGSNRSFDIDPNNIESVKILKGLAATNIYGSEGRNGVVLITTKTGALSQR